MGAATITVPDRGTEPHAGHLRTPRILVNMNRLPVLVFCLASACTHSSPKEPAELAPMAIGIVRNPEFQAPAAATFELVKGVMKLPANSGFDAQKIEAAVRKALILGLDKRGWEPGAEGQADLRVGYAAVHGDVVGDKQLARIFGIAPGWQPRGEFVYHKGTLLVFISDGRTGGGLWLGAIQGQVHENLDDKVREKRIAEAVDALLARLR